MLADPAAATPLALVSDSRLGTAKYCNYFCDFAVFQPSSPFAPLDATATLSSHPGVLSSQDTTISESAMGGTLLGVIPSMPPPFPLDPQQGAFFEVTDQFRVTFDATESTPYALSLVLTHAGNPTVSALLRDITASTSLFQLSPPGTGSGIPLVFNTAGSLIAGHRYTLEIGMQTSGAPFRHTSAAFGFNLYTAVPEPSTAALLGVGLLALAARRIRN